MSTPAAVLEGPAGVARWGPHAAALGVVALAARPLGPWGAAVALAVGAAGLAWPAARSTARPGRWLGAVAVGATAFALVRFSLPGLALRGSGIAVAVAVAVAVAEEAFFRRFLYDLLARAGAGAAIGGGAIAFALVHVPIYGAWVVPLDLAAGLLLGWQRWAAGHWSAPAATHALANVLAYWR